ncbi:TonB-dependent receptor [Paraflavitalea sp. CAU 1676]|uniref:TonB-dependent receptor n=1 Tax=Paraflavitalea sp. CAU 1676 TaxID=3032598 RepID=UPI0023DCA76D|nr:TonB-dependent receptor [Paraflavitalea sp. CAU 1676]MDF2188880.1 TonB-dependent receptor [Paraflavitalea sp. CAU 1676]
MRNSFQYRAAVIHLLLLLFAATTTNSQIQTYTITGTIRNSTNKDVVPAVSVTVKGTTLGTFSDEKGQFRIVTSQRPPLTLIVSSIGFEAQEITVNNASDAVEVNFVPASVLGLEVVVSASRSAERILESPVSIERMSAANVRAAGAPSFYQGLANYKGVDLVTSSLTFNTLSTRGFNGSGNLRFNQLVDGMDNQAPALNFSVGIITGPTELDIDNVELLQGASSALYGSGGMTGTLLMTSKNPFKYQGLSFQVKQGIMHVNSNARSAAPYYDWAFRWGKKLSENLAFKIGGQFVSGQDWQANDTRNLARNNVLSTIKPGTRSSDPNYDGINVYGDEASVSMQGLAQVIRAQVSANPAAAPAVAAVDAAIAAGFTAQQIAANPALQPIQAYLPFLIPTSPSANNPYKNTYGSQLVSRTGYNESDMVDYDAYSIKLNGGLYYKINNNVEASAIAYWGAGTTVYTGADRYSLKNFKLGQYQVEVKSKNWFLRGYTTQENSGDSYTATTAALAVNNLWKPNGTWFQQYTGIYGVSRLGIIPNGSGGFLPVLPDGQAHSAARSAGDNGRILPGTQAFEDALKTATGTNINDKTAAGGARFADKSALYHFEGQYNLSQYIKVVEVMVGANYRIYHLNSNGTIFSDSLAPIDITEYGGYIQLQKRLFNDVLKLTASGRYDKNENFDGRFTPRVTALIKVAKDNNLRLSFQTAYRFPSTQDQYIDLNVPGARLIGALPEFKTYYNFDTKPAYTATSIADFRASVAAGTPNPGLLKVAPFKEMKPETANSYEFGYRGLPVKNFLVDAYIYYCEYKDFLGKTAVGRPANNGPLAFVANPLTTEQYSYAENSESKVKAIGWGIGGEYRMNGGYNVRANVSGDQLRDVPAGLITYFNTPKVRFNVGVGNESIAKSPWGFNFVYRWQDKMNWEGTFAAGEVPAYGTLDGQVSYKLQKIRSLIKLGGSNLLNKYYYSSLGNPYVGGIYYISFGYNIF